MWRRTRSCLPLGVWSHLSHALHISHWLGPTLIVSAFLRFKSSNLSEVTPRFGSKAHLVTTRRRRAQRRPTTGIGPTPKPHWDWSSLSPWCRVLLGPGCCSPSHGDQCAWSKPAPALPPSSLCQLYYLAAHCLQANMQT